MVGCCVTLALAAAAGCEQPVPPPPAPPAVTVTTPVIRTVEGYTDFTGNTEAYEAVEIRARVEGYLQEIHFEPSAVVQEGDLLFTIEQETFQAAVDQANADVERAKADRTQAEWDLEQVIELERSGAANVKEVQDKTTARLVAAANLKSAQASLLKAETDFAYTTIRSPITGRVSRNLVDVGNLVGAGEQTLLTTVRDMRPIYVYFDMPEILLQGIREEREKSERRQLSDFPMLFGLASEQGHPHVGALDYIDNTVDPATGTIRTRGVYANEDLEVLPGFFVRVRLPGDPIANAVLVSDRAIGSDLEGKFLMVVDADNIVQKRAVNAGGLYAGMRHIIEGLAPGEQYIVNGLQRARPGMPVTPTVDDAPQTPQSEAPIEATDES